jgi:cob(I)alamin adenosyltransferase
MPAGIADVYLQESNSFRQAAQKAAADPRLANNLSAIATDLHRAGKDLGSKSAFRADLTQQNRDIATLTAICGPAYTRTPA